MNIFDSLPHFNEDITPEECYPNNCSKINKHVIAIYSKDHKFGNGVIIQNLLVTAGHVVVNSEDAFICWKDERIELASLEKVYVSIAKDNDELDLAVYRMPRITSPLNLSLQEATAGQSLISHSIKETQNGSEPIECNAQVCNHKEGLYIRAITDYRLKPGCSGSPLLSGNEVCGIIVVGNNKGDDSACEAEQPLNEIYFLPSPAIIEAIKPIILNSEIS